jgi:hypothetical protein
MKRTLLIISLSVTLALSGLSLVNAQEQPKPQKDTVNMDTQAKPTFYYATEDEKSPAKKGHTNVAVPLIIVAGVIIVAAAGVFIYLKNKKAQ